MKLIIGRKKGPKTVDGGPGKLDFEFCVVSTDDRGRRAGDRGFELSKVSEQVKILNFEL